MLRASASLFEILHLVERANLDVRIFAGHWIWATLDPLNRLLKRLTFPKPETGDEFLRFGERPVGHGSFRSRKSDPHCIRAGLQSFTRLRDAGLGQLLVIFAHC